MIALILADVVVNNPCAGIDPDSWLWILRGCWLIGRSASAGPLALGVTMAGMVGALLWSQRGGRA